MTEQASIEVLNLRNAEATWLGVTHQNTGGNCMVTFLQLGTLVFVVGQDDYDVLVYDVSAWLGLAADDGQPMTSNRCETALDALAVLQKRARLSDYEWQCGGCDATIYTIERRMSGVLQCAACIGGGIDFDFHARHIGDDDE